MSGIGGSKKEKTDFGKKVGLFAAKVLCVNPNTEEFKEILGMELKEDSKATEYLGESKEGNTTLRVDFWLEGLKDKGKYKTTFFLEDKKKENKTEEGDGKVKKFQYINEIGQCSWADDPNNLNKWFTKREYRIANVGEEELYNFMRTWLGTLDFFKSDTTLQIEWKKLMKGNVSDIKAQVNGEYCVNIVPLAGIKTVDKDGEIKEYQSIYNKAFMPEYALKQFNLVDYDNPEVQEKLKEKEAKAKLDKNIKLGAHERFVLNVISAYGFKDFYKFKPLADYDASENPIATNEPMVTDSDSLPF